MSILNPEIIAGLGSGALVTVFFHPLDTIRINQIKTKDSILKVFRNLYINNEVESQTFIKKHIYGALRLYRALPIGCLAYSITYGIYFPINQHFKNQDYLHCSHKYLLYMMSTIPATTCSMTITNPLWTIKSVQISAPQPISIFQSAAQIYKTSGIMGFQKGLLLGYLNGLNGVITFTLYDIFKDAFGSESSIDYAMCAALSKTCAYFITFPIFSLRIQHQITQDTLVNVFIQQAKSLRTLYCGLTMTLLQMVPRTSLMLVLYEKIKTLF